MTARKPLPDKQIVAELRQAGWSLGGIASIYGITPAAVRMLLGEKIGPTFGSAI